MLQLNINGQHHEVAMEADTPLLWVLRDGLKLTGTKFGCGIAVCGTCVVLVNGKPVRSCVTPVSAVAGRDPVKARLELMDDHPRHAGVVKLAAKKAGWGKKLPAGRARGIAVAESFASYVAMVAEVSIEKGAVSVHRMTCAVDCGMTVNPNSIRAQMEGAIVYGLTASLKGKITIAGGQIQQRNFDDYPLLRLEECPHIDVHIIDNEQAPGGVGEPGVPPTAPAVANAVFALTGKPVRSLPIADG